MKPTSASPTADAPDGAAAEEGEASAPPAAPNLSKPMRIALICCLAVDAAIVLTLGVWNTTLTRSAWDLIGTALLFGIGIALVLAIGAVLRKSPNALLTVVVSQIFMVFLAAYVWLVDERSPTSQLWGVTGIALVLGGIALFWVIFLGRFARGAVGRGAIVATALLPVMGLVQYWMQTEYLPQSSLPLVDVETQLSPAGATGPIIHLKAVTTLHNRGSFQVDLPAGLTRIHTYPRGTQTEAPTPEAVAAHIDPMGSLIGDYRETPASPAQARLVYASSFGSTAGSFLAPGSTFKSEVVIDVDSRSVRLATLAVTVIAVTHRAVKETLTCYPPQRSYNRDTEAFLLEAHKLHDWEGGKVLCTQTQFASRGIIEELVSDHPALRILTLVQNNVLETPTLVPFFGTRESLDNPLENMDVAESVESSSPSGVFGASSEYAPSDADTGHAHG